MQEKLLLDLFCGAGGCSVGYHQAGFKVIGVDIKKSPRYPFDFIQADAIEILNDTKFLSQFDVIHASPPCQAYSIANKMIGNSHTHPDLIPVVRELLVKSGKPYVIENAEHAPLINSVLLCGTMFQGLNTVRHRKFECNPVVLFPPFLCNHRKKTIRPGRVADWNKYYMTITGHFTGVNDARNAMGIDWMTGRELTQAIPPAYTKYIGTKILELINQQSL
jgi:DNA (cytosine-5)-methyltransferase 1